MWNAYFRQLRPRLGLLAIHNKVSPGRWSSKSVFSTEKGLNWTIMTNLLSFHFPCYFQAVQFVFLLHVHNQEHFFWFDTTQDPVFLLKTESYNLKPPRCESQLVIINERLWSLDRWDHKPFLIDKIFSVDSLCNINAINWPTYLSFQCVLH